MASTSKKPLTAAQWFGTGDQFWHGASVLGSHEATGCDRGVLPMLVARAFAAEAYLKSLRVIRKRPFVPKHDLVLLFSDLREVDKQSIRNEWDKRQLPHVLAFAQGKPKGMPLAHNFDEALQLSKDAFMDWRYDVYTGARWYLGEFPLYVREQILKYRPTWGAKPPNMFGKFTPGLSPAAS